MLQWRKRPLHRTSPGILFRHLQVTQRWDFSVQPISLYRSRAATFSSHSVPSPAGTTSVRSNKATEGAAHLKNLDTSPRSKRAALLTFVSNHLVLLTRASAALSGSSVTIVRTGLQT